MRLPNLNSADDEVAVNDQTEAGIALRRSATKVGMEPREGGQVASRGMGSFTCTAAADAWPGLSVRAGAVRTTCR